MRKSQKGMSLAEVLVGLMILSVMILTTITATTTALKLTKNNVNKEFATQKAISMLEELRAQVQTSSEEALTFLDAFDDGTTNKYILTTQGQLPLPSTTQPGDAISGNSARGTGWLYERNISVQPVPGQGNDVRFVNVKVFINEDGRKRLLAEVASVLRTLVVDMPPTQVYDVYAVAVENVPGWWVYMSNIEPFVRTSISDLQARNPGLEFRTHWINTLSYGRDEQYRPYINKVADSTADVNWAYFYPGKMPPINSPLIGDDYYYPLSLFKGVMNIDGTKTNGYHATDNPWPYAIADQFNAAMRYYDEKERYDKRKLANPEEEPTWRLLLEDMYSQPAKYTNAIVINLHGELLPFPPIRNYSDAAKSPTALPNIRAVTHPEQLRYNTGEPVKLRVYTYRMDPDAAGSGSGVDWMSTPVTIKITGLAGTWAPAAGDIKIIRGGTDQDAAAGAEAYDQVPVNAPAGGAANNLMYYVPSSSAGTTTLKLYRSPLKHRQAAGAGMAGLSSDARLYRLEYIPAPLEDLTVTGTAGQFNQRHLGWFPRVLSDTFSTDAYNNNNGSAAWLGNWTEVDGDTNATTFPMRVESGLLKLRETNTTANRIYRSANLSGYQKAILTFDVSTATGDAPEGTDRWRMEISADAGATWVYPQDFTGPFATVSPRRYDITPYISADTRVRFSHTAGYSGSETFQIDNFRISDVGSGDVPKNTARWMITVPAVNVADGSKLTIETRIGDTTTTGVMYPAAIDPPNLSRTYVWKGSNLWTFGDGGNNLPNLPLTERFQFLGDPRHCPYADLKRPHEGAGFGGLVEAGGYESKLGMGYNRFFDDFETFTGNTDGLGAPDGNAAAAELIAGEYDTYNITASNNIFAVSVNGEPPFSVTLTNGGTRSAADVAKNLNDNATFRGVAVADVVDAKATDDITQQWLRIRSKDRRLTGSIQFDTATGTSEGELGFTNKIASVPWPGWRYYQDNDETDTLYGIKNNDQAAFDRNDTNTYDDAKSYVNDEQWSNAMEIDVSRSFQTLRSALMQSNVLWTTMTGYSYYYMGIGNEIGYDCANNFGESVPVSWKPFNGTSGQRQEQTILPNISKSVSGVPCDTTACLATEDICTSAPYANGLGCGVKYVRQQSTANGWWSLSWLGELYPDSQYSTDSDWEENGNLKTGTGANRFIRAQRDNMWGFAGTKLLPSQRRTATRGCTSVFWGEASDAAFHHEGVEGEGLIQDDGIDIRNNYSLPVPDKIPNNRPWQVNWNAPGNNPENFLTSAYPGANQLQPLARYFKRIEDNTTTQKYCWNHDGNAATPNVTTECPNYASPSSIGPEDFNANGTCKGTPLVIGDQPTEGSGLIAVSDANQKPVFIIVNGLSPTGVTGTTFIAKWSFLTLIQSFLNGGAYVDTKTPLASPANKYNIRQLPRITITAPNINTDLNNPSSVTITWAEQWTRWDGRAYSAKYPAGCQILSAGCYTPDFTRKYVVLYSPSNGAPDPEHGNPTGWFYLDGTTAELGKRNLAKAVPGVALTTSISTPAATFPQGNYVFRVEAYRVGYEQHYSYHQYRAFIQR